MPRLYLTVAEIEVIHSMTIEQSGGMPGVRDRGLLEAAVFRPQCGYYMDLIEEAAALMESLIQNHPFHEGNKRTGFVAANTFLYANGLRMEVTADDAEAFILNHLRQGTFRFHQVKDWLRQIVRPVGKAPGS